MALAHLRKNKIEFNLSVPGIQGHQENTLYKSFETSPHLICLSRPASRSLEGQSETRPEPEAGPEELLVLAQRHINGVLIWKLLMRAFLWRPWIPGTLKLDSILSLFKCVRGCPCPQMMSIFWGGGGVSQKVAKSDGCWEVNQ